MDRSCSGAFGPLCACGHYDVEHYPAGKGQAEYELRLCRRHRCQCRGFKGVITVEPARFEVAS